MRIENEFQSVMQFRSQNKSQKYEIEFIKEISTLKVLRLSSSIYYSFWTILKTTMLSYPYLPAHTLPSLCISNAIYSFLLSPKTTVARILKLVLYHYKH